MLPTGTPQVDLISSLPDEILHLVLSNFTTYTTEGKQALSSCCLVSKQFDSIARPILWKWVRISPPTLPAEGQHLGTGGIPLPQRDINVSDWPERLRNHVTFLSIKYHDNGRCSSRHSPDLRLPNLKVLQLELKDTDYHSGFHISCPLVEALRPETVIFREADYNLETVRSPVLSQQAWSNVEIAIYISPYYSRRVSGFPVKRSIVPGRPGRLTRVYWIVDSKMIWIPRHDPVRRVVRCRERRLEDCLLSFLLETFQDENISITIVNVGPSYRYLPATSVGEAQESETIFRSRLDFSSSCRNLTHKQLKRQQDRFTFMTLDEFLANEDWRGKMWFDEREVEEWREAVAEVDRQCPPDWTRDDVG